MAIDSNPVSKPTTLLAVFTSSGNFTIPTGTNKVFVSVSGASGGSAGHGTRYFHRYVGGAGGNTKVAAGWVNVIPGSTHVVTIGAAGTGGASSNRYGAGAAGNAGGSSSFGSFIVQSGGGGGNSAGAPAGPNGNAGAAGGTTFLTETAPVVPWSGVETAVVGTNSNVVISGSAAPTARYDAGPAGIAGTSGKMFIYG